MPLRLIAAKRPDSLLFYGVEKLFVEGLTGWPRVRAYGSGMTCVCLQVAQAFLVTDSVGFVSSGIGGIGHLV